MEEWSSVPFLTFWPSGPHKQSIELWNIWFSYLWGHAEKSNSEMFQFNKRGSFFSKAFAAFTVELLK